MEDPLPARLPALGGEIPGDLRWVQPWEGSVWEGEWTSVGYNQCHRVHPA